jgi:subtilisin family serine protease
MLIARMPSRRDHRGTRLAPAVKDMATAARIAGAVGTSAALAALAASALTAAARPAAADSVRDAQRWVLDDVRAPLAWPLSEGRGITVAVLDSGVDPAVSDLAGSVAAGPDYTHTGTAPSSPHWGEHGTWMASLIAGHGHGGGASGILGVAPQAQILSIRVITDRDDPGYQHYQHEAPDTIQNALASAIRYAVSHGAAVISMSIGYSAPSSAVRAALQYAGDRGVVVVASSGNSGDSWFARTHSYAPYSFPADYPGVLAVGAADRNGARAGFSSDNLSVQVAAPGVNVPAQGRDGQYWEVSGTSPACALVAGAVALIKARYPDLSPALIGEAVVSTTHDRPLGGYDERVGFGMVDAAAALARAKVLAKDMPAGGLRAGSAVGGRDTTSAGQYFGGGPRDVPRPPVRPRGIWPLAGFGLLGLLSLILIVGSLTRIIRVRRSVRHAAAAFDAAADWAPAGFRAVPPRQDAAGPPAGYTPLPLDMPAPLSAPPQETPPHLPATPPYPPPPYPPPPPSGPPSRPGPGAVPPSNITGPW